MNIHELDDYNLADAVKFNDQLNPAIWQGQRMRPEVREALLRIADDFREFLGISDIEVKDITVSGSNAAYTYTPHSDIDLHLVVDIPQADSDDVYRELFDAKKYQYNDQHDYTIGGYDVELYVEDANKPPRSQGIYSVMNDDWVKIPLKRRAGVDDESVKNKFEDVGHRIEAAIKSGDYRTLDQLAKKIKNMRQTGLEQHGEFGAENLAYKILRTQGLIKQLYDARNRARDQEFSITERKKKRGKKRTRYGFGGFWYPGFGYGGNDSGDAGGGGDGGGMEDVTSTPDGVGPSTRMFLSEKPTMSDEEILKDFVDFVIKELKIKQRPAIKLRRDPQWSKVHKTFGRYTDQTHTLEVAWGQRHIMDVLRTVAHELTHKRQHEREDMPADAGETGSPYENEANARAGILMRDYGRLHPEYFEAGQAHDLEEGWRERAGAAALAACVAGTPGCATTDNPVGQGLGMARDALIVSNVAKNLTRDDLRYHAGVELNNYLRSLGGDTGAANLSVINRLQRKLQQEKRQERQTVPENASGYIPTKKQAKDPRFVMALSKDIKPGQVGKEANKMALKTDSQGHPDLLIKGLRNALREFKETGRINESPEYSFFIMPITDLSKRDVTNELRRFGGRVFHDRKAHSPNVTVGVPAQVKDRFVRSMSVVGSRLTPAIDWSMAANKDLAEMDYLGNQDPTGPERPVEYPKGTVKVGVSDVYDWYKLGQHISDLKGLGHHDFGQGPPETILAFGSEPIEHKYIKDLKKLGLKTHDLDEPGEEDVDEDCWTGYRQAGMKKKGDRQVPNCVPVNEEEDLLEVKMSPGELRKWAESPEAEGIRAGFEAEMIFRDTSGGESEDDEPDYGMDERARDIDEVVDFFRGGDEGISGGMANRLRESLYEEYIEWRETQIYNQWEEVADEQVRDYMETNIWGDDDQRDEYRERAREELGIETSEQSAERAEEIEARARELFDADVEQSIEDEDRNYDEAREYYRDMMADSDDFDQYDWFRDSYPSMSDVAEGFGLDWPYRTGGREGNGERSIDDIAQSLNYAIDMPVMGSSGYHSLSRRPGRWIIEPDGSLDPDDPDDELGLEIVSPPMPLPETLRKLQQVIDWANGDGNAYTNSSTGLHMGMSIPFKGGDVDYIKLILFMGDQYVLEKFERTANTYCASALEKLRQTQTARRRGVREQETKSMTGAEKTAAAMDLMRKNLIELAQRYVQDGVGLSKYTSAHIKDGYIEFRSPGGDYLSLNDREDQALEDTMLRFARAMYIAGRPDLERKEYSKKLYKLLSGFKGAETSRDTKRDTKYRTRIETEDQNDAMDLFARYSSGMINAEELKKQWAEQVLAKEAPPQRSQDDAREYEVVRRDTGEVIDTIRDWSLKSANETALVKYSGQGFDWLVREKTDAEPEKKLSRRAQVAKRIKERPSIWRVTDTNTNRSITVAADGTQDAKYQARNQDENFKKLFYNDPDSMLVEPASAEEVKQFMAQYKDMKQDSRQVQQRVQGSPGRYRVRWTERRGEREAQDSLTVDAANADAAMAAIRHALQAQGRDVINIEASLAGSTQDLQQQRAQQSGGEFTGRWNIQDALSGEVLHTISGIGNNQGDANRHAREWIERTGYSGAYEIVPEMR